MRPKEERKPFEPHVAFRWFLVKFVGSKDMCLLCKSDLYPWQRPKGQTYERKGANGLARTYTLLAQVRVESYIMW